LPQNLFRAKLFLSALVLLLLEWGRRVSGPQISNELIIEIARGVAGWRRRLNA
jgi:hypothetical protein